ncbi:MAG: undecaprenyl-phosphate glucose phosphotransferase [Bilifractor sp.]
MNKESQISRVRMQIIVDAVLVIISYLLAWELRFNTHLFGPYVRVLTLRYYIQILVFIVPLFLLVNYIFQLYNVTTIQSRRVEMLNIIRANTVGILIVVLGLYLVKQQHFARNMLFIFYVFNVVFDGIARNIVHVYLRRRKRNPSAIRKILLVGYSNAAEQYIDRVNSNPEWGNVVVGILDDFEPNGSSFRGVKVLGTCDRLQEILDSNEVDEIAITLRLREYFKLEDLVKECEKSGIHTQFIPDYYNIISTKPYTEDIMGLPVINIRYVPLMNGFNAFIKRVIDIIGSLIAIVIFSPVMLICVIGIKVTSPGPLIFRQKRVGLHNKEFLMYKFRSMTYVPDPGRKAKWTVKDDPRVTKFGKFMRRTSFDELPQLFNVLKGEMSLVGPRPEQLYFVEKFREEIPRYMVKHQVRPGMTGWAQVHGYRGDTSIRKRIDYDLYYIENWTLGLDFKILFMTLFKGFVNKNAY